MRKKLTPAESKARRSKRQPVVIDSVTAKLAAETLYVTGTRSLAALHELHPEIGTVSLRTLERSSVEGRWAEKRSEYREAVAKKALAELSARHAAKRVEEISALEEVRDTIVHRLRAGDFEPKTFDSAISGIV
ncbi:MAG: hypothetical protein AAF355_01880 [Myxococcota bacterium]